jgi:hypothetical protein
VLWRGSSNRGLAVASHSKKRTSIKTRENDRSATEESSDSVVSCLIKPSFWLRGNRDYCQSLALCSTFARTVILCVCLPLQSLLNSVCSIIAVSRVHSQCTRAPSCNTSSVGLSSLSRDPPGRWPVPS